MKKVKTVIALLVSLTLLVTCFGCAKKEEPTSEKIFEAGEYTEQNCSDIQGGYFEAHRYNKITIKAGAVIKAKFILNYNMKIRGEGVIENTDDYAIKIIGGITSVEGIKIISEKGIFIDNNNGSSVKNATITAREGAGIVVNNSKNISVYNCTINSKGDNFQVLANGEDTVSKKIKFFNNSLTCQDGANISIGDAFDGGAIDEVQFINNTIISSKGSFYKLRNSGGGISNIEVKDITVEDFASTENTFIDVRSERNTKLISFTNILVNKTTPNSKIILSGGIASYKIDAVTFSKIKLGEVIIDKDYPYFTRENGTSMVLFIWPTVNGEPEPVTGAQQNYVFVQ